MERLGLNKRNIFNIGIDSCLRNTKYNKINLIKSKHFEKSNLDNSKVVKESDDAIYKKINDNCSTKSNLCGNDFNISNEKNNKINLKDDFKTVTNVVYEQKNKKRKSNKRWIVIVVLIFIIFLIFEIFTTLIEPSLIAMCEIRANSIGVTVSSKAVKQVMEEVGYDIQLINLEKDNEGNIIALKANVVQMNYIASLIGSRTQQMYNELTETYVQIPIGNFTGNALLAGRGPRIRVKIMPVGTVGSDFKTEFVSSGINQTRHRVYLQVVSSMRVIAPFSTKTIKVVNNVNVAETVLIGNVPNSYYNLEGVDNVVDDSLNLWDE